MMQHHDNSAVTVRPLVRYVDEDQAIIDVQFDLEPPTGDALDPHARLEVAIAMQNGDGSSFQHHDRLVLDDWRGTVRFAVRRPQRWWPAGMGAQTLYELTVELYIDDRLAHAWQSSMGFTSVRLAGGDPGRRLDVLLVNGRERHIDAVVPLEPGEEQQLLPVGGDSLVVVRHHFGSEVLFEAADRAGILLVQALEPGADRDRMVGEIDRLRVHPSLAGWLAPAGSPLHRTITRLDPTRRVFAKLPPQG